MANIPAASQAKGIRSASFRIETITALDTVSNASLLTVCAEGPLKNILDSEYLGVGGTVNFINAFGGAGGLLSWSADDAINVYWALSAGFKPELKVTSSGGAYATVRLALSWSASS